MKKAARLQRTTRLRVYCFNSDELRQPRHCHRCDRHRTPFVFLGSQILLGFHGLFPGDLFPGVACHPAHDRQHRAAAHVFAVIDRRGIADRCEQLIVFRLVHVVLRAFVLPFRLSRNRMPKDVAGPLRPHDVVGNVDVSPILLTAGGKPFHPVRIFVNHAHVIEDVTEFRPGPDLPTAEADALHRRFVCDVGIRGVDFQPVVSASVAGGVWVGGRGSGNYVDCWLRAIR